GLGGRVVDDRAATARLLRVGRAGLVEAATDRIDVLRDLAPVGHPLLALGNHRGLACAAPLAQGDRIEVGHVLLAQRSLGRRGRRLASVAREDRGLAPCTRTVAATLAVAFL